MNFFGFDADRSTISVAKDFWIFWAIVGPISVLTGMAGLFYIWWRQSQSVQDIVQIQTGGDAALQRVQMIPGGPFLS